MGVSTWWNKQKYIIKMRPWCYSVSHYNDRLTRWGQVTQICINKLVTIGSDNVLSPCRHQVIIWTNDGILLIRTLETIFSEILIEISTFSFEKMHLKMSSGKWRPYSLGLNVLMGVLILRRCLLYWNWTDTICAPNNINQRCIIQCIFHVSLVHPPDPGWLGLMDGTTLSDFGPVFSPLLGVS